jgi:PAS domain S-box-containing protein
MANGTRSSNKPFDARGVGSDALLASIVDSSDDAIISKDITGHITSWNRAAEKMFGYTAQEALGQSVTLIVPPERLHEETEILERISKGERVEHFETRRRHRDGRLVDVSLTISPVRDQQGKVIGASKVVRDISEQKRSSELRGLFAAIVNSSDDAIISKDLESIITSWNSGAERMFGYTASEAIGRPIWMLFPPDRIFEETDILAKIKRGERVDHFETQRMRKDGSLIDLSVTISPVKDAQGRVVGASKIARDIGEQRMGKRAIEMARRELEHANRQLRLVAVDLETRVREKTAELEANRQDWESFAYSISHDLRSQVRTVFNFTKLLHEQLQGKIGVEEQDYLHRLTRAAARISSMIDGVLAFTRVTRAQMQLQEVNLDTVVLDIIDASAELQPPAQVRVERPLGSVCANAAGLHQCLANLLSNAVKYVRPDKTPEVVVRSETRGEFLRLWVEDSGIGIPEEEQAHLFQMFQRMNNARGYEGTGLGLAIVRRAVERMGGKVGVESAVGRGSRFWVELKKTPASEANSSNAPQ